MATAETKTAPQPRVTVSARVKVAARGRGDASVVELAEDWLAAKSLAGRSETDNSAQARRRDLCRWGRALQSTLGRAVDESGLLDVEVDLAGLRLRELTADNCLHALSLLRSSGKASSTARMLSTWRGFCRWLVRRGYLRSDPTDDDLLTVTTSGERLPRAFTIAEVDRLRTVALDPSPRARSAWPTRDLAIVELLAGSGARVSETAALQVGDVDRRHQVVILRLRRSTKSGNERDIPLPDRVVDALDSYLAERTLSGRAQPLLVRLDGERMTRQDLDEVLRRLCRAGGVTAPDGEMAHGLRHHYGTQLALHGVPVRVIQQLLGHADPRTSSIYTRVAAQSLVDALTAAGMLNPQPWHRRGAR
jgi:site-specific recombinase XerD